MIAASNPHPELDHLLTVVEAFRRRELDLETLQAAVWGAAQALTSFDDRELRRQLEAAEGRLEAIRFTTDDDQVRDAVLAFLEDVEALLKAGRE